MSKKYIPTWKWQIAIWWQENVYRIAWANTKDPNPGKGWNNIWQKLWITKAKV